MNASTTILEAPLLTTSPRLQQRLQKLLRNTPSFELHPEHSTVRHELEEYIRKTFAKAYNAEVSVFAPLLLELRCAGSISGVAGIRPAAALPLFVEHYLDAPAEQCISNLTGSEVRRDEVVEVCNLAALRPGACQLITVMLAASLFAAGYRYAILAGTSQLMHILSKQNFAFRILCAADPASLGNEAQQWGSYYQTDPQVLVVDLEATLRSIDAHWLTGAIIEVLHDTVISLGQTLAGTRYIRNRTTPAPVPA